MLKQNTRWKALQNLRNIWEAALDAAQKNKIKMILENGSSIFFFRYEKEIYGASEGARVTFAKMKDETDDDHTQGWMKEACFTALNLTKLGQGQQVQMVFFAKDLGKIDVLTKEEAYDALEDFYEKEKDDKRKENGK